MAVAISAAPHLVEAPAFAALAIHVPLSENPDPAWLRALLRIELPGRAHRLVDGGIEFYLDRDNKDIAGAMKRIAEAIAETERTFAEAQEEERRKDERRAAGEEARREKINRQLEEWWDANGPGVSR